MSNRILIRSKNDSVIIVEKQEMKSANVETLDSKPRFRREVVIEFYKEDERGLFYVAKIEHPSPQYVKIHETAKKAIECMDGTKTIEEISEISKLEKEALEYLIEHLRKRGFIEGYDPQPDTEEIETIPDTASFRIKLFTPSSWVLKRFSWMRYVVSNKWVGLLYFLFVVAGIIAFSKNINQIIGVMLALGRYTETYFPIQYLVISLVLLYLVELVHEIAHASVYSYYGGKKVEIGLEFHFLIGFFYAKFDDAYSVPRKERAKAIAMGPLTSIFFASLFSILYSTTTVARDLWAIQAFFWYFSTVMISLPTIKTDSYYLLQEFFRFPYLLENSWENLRKLVLVLFRKIKWKEYQEFLSQYSRSEKRAMFLLSFLIPLGFTFQIVLGFFLLVYLYVVDLMLMTPEIVFRRAQLTPKLLVLWLSTIWAFFLLVVGIMGTAKKAVKRRITIKKVGKEL